MPSLLSDYIKSVSFIQPEVLSYKLGILTSDLAANPPTFQNTISSEHYFDGYHCSDIKMLNYKIQKSILDKLFSRNPDIAPCNKQEIIACQGIANIDKMKKVQTNFFLMQHALVFSITRIGNCSERGAYAALLLFDLLRDTNIKVGLQSLKTKDQFVVCLGNTERGWMVYDPFTNPNLVFEWSDYQENMIGYFETYSRPKVPFKVTINQKHYEQFLEQKAHAQHYVAERLHTSPPRTMLLDEAFFLHIQKLGVTIQEFSEAHAQLCALVSTSEPSPIPSY